MENNPIVLSITNGYKKIANPVIGKPYILFSYEGLLYDDFDFGQQSNNFNKIKNIFNKMNIQPVNIYYVKWINKKGERTTEFILTFSNPSFIWHKTNHNKIYMNRYHIKVSNFDETIFNSSWKI